MRAVEYGYMYDALIAAGRSTDPSTQNGAVLVTAPGYQFSGYNTLPAGLEPTADRYVRPDKYAWVEHAERSVIFMAAKAGVQTEGATMYCVWAACPDCARAIIGAGITRLVRLPLDAEGHWKEPVALGDLMLREAGVAVMTLETSFGVSRRRNEVWVTL